MGKTGKVKPPGGRDFKMIMIPVGPSLPWVSRPCSSKGGLKDMHVDGMVNVYDS
jgi:hypothetical protein